MAHVDQLMNYFGNTRAKPARDRWIGSEVETFFIADDGRAITIEQSQHILRHLAGNGWVVEKKKADMLTEVSKGTSRILYELGYPNLELSVCPHERNRIIGHTKSLLDELYRAAEAHGAHPHFAPIFAGNGDYLAIPDERDAAWLTLDGRKALSPLARTSAVQFTLDVSPDDSIEKLKKLLARRKDFLDAYPQDAVWRRYIASSRACYLPDRYGGPDDFASLAEYCEKLCGHDVVRGTGLVPFRDADLSGNEDISLFIRSIWWYFRLRKYGRNLCIEVRPIPRRRDELLDEQLDMVLDIVG